MVMVPLRDPIKNIVYNATIEDLRDVMIDGEWVMRDGQVLTVDERAVSRALQQAGERVWSSIDRDVAESVDELSPQTFPDFE